MGASPYIEREARIIAIGRDIRTSSATYLMLLNQEHTYDPDQREAARRELLRRSLFSNQKRKSA